VKCKRVHHNERKKQLWSNKEHDMAADATPRRKGYSVVAPSPFFSLDEKTLARPSSEKETGGEKRERDARGS
jgi:hypothetical protein